jgi:hypothetical protein
MNSSKLVRCAECGHSISSSASQCPKCNDKQPFVNVCAFCDQEFKDRRTESIALPNLRNIHRYGLDIPLLYYHHKCIGSILPKTKCRDCGNVIDIRSEFQKNIDRKTHLYDKFSCPDCGCQNPFDDHFSNIRCDSCGLPIYKLIHKKISSRRNSNSLDKLRQYYFHSACCNTETAKQITQYCNEWRIQLRSAILVIMRPLAKFQQKRPHGAFCNSGFSGDGG